MRSFLKYFLGAILLFSPFFVFAKTDVSVSGTDITFSKTEFAAGETVRIYARAFNAGDTDVSAYVEFLNNGQQIASAQPISLKPNTYDDVFIDWKAAPGPNNINAKIIGASPEDVNPTNNQTSVKQITVANPPAEQKSQIPDESSVNDAARDFQPIETTALSEGWQEILANFEKENPVKSGIATLDQKINDQILHWYKLATGDNSEKKPQTAFSFSRWQAGIMDAVTPYIKNKNAYMYAGIGVLVVIALLFFWRRKSGQEEYYD